MSATTPKFGLPYPVPDDSVDVPRDVQALAVALDSALGAVWRVGDVKLSAVAGDQTIGGQEWMLADGRMIATATYPAFLAAVGHAYNGGVDPGGGMIRIPDMRGRAPVGPDSMGTLTGAASRVTANNVRGSGGGVEKHPLGSGEMPTHDHNYIYPAAINDGGGNFALLLLPASLQSSMKSNLGDIAFYGNGEGVGGALPAASGGWASPITQRNDYAYWHGITAAPAHVGTASGHQNMQPYQVFPILVRVK